MLNISLFRNFIEKKYHVTYPKKIRNFFLTNALSLIFPPRAFLRSIKNRGVNSTAPQRVTLHNYDISP